MLPFALALVLASAHRAVTSESTKVPPAAATPIPSAKDARFSWWSLQPLLRPPVPVPRRGFRVTNPIDAFVAAKLTEKGLPQSPEADRRTLIRRVCYDLIGLPPTPAEIEQFLADQDSKAYERLIDRLLASPAYGERWARHWLDIVHYGETHGYDKDQPRPNAWPYRDYVIRSFNQDKCYTRFIQEQLAGDVLFPSTRDGIEGLGFISAGPWDLIGHAEVPESKMDGRVARHLDRDDMVATTMQTFNSLTVQCAQCHNHKFDPIAQEDYYCLQAVFAAVDRADKKYDIDPAVAQKRKTLGDRQATLTARQQEMEGNILARAGQAIADLDKRLDALAKSAKEGAAAGYHSNIEKKPDLVKWVQVDLGRSLALSNIVLHPCLDNFNNIGPGFGFPVRFKVELSDDPKFEKDVALVSDHTAQEVANPKLAPQSVETGGRTARYIRVTATQLMSRQDDYIFALAELDALTSDGKNVARGATVTALDSIEATPRWQKSNLTDGWYPGAAATAGEIAELAALRSERAERLAQATLAEEKTALAGMEHDLAAVKSALEQMPVQSATYVGAVHHGSGNFVGTGSKGGQPRPIHVLNRGNLQKPGQEVGPGTLGCLPGLPSRFELPPNSGEGERRAALARWLTDAKNPLTWRSVVNRVWQYHFGRGLVETPNDFGRMGALPTHPELLEWLAVEFRDGGQSLKGLHKLLVSSATYRQASVDGDGPRRDGGTVAAARPTGSPPAGVPPAQIDSDNRYLWRMNRRKLEAEAVRDSILFVSGALDLNMGGPSFKDFVVEKPEHSPHYEYHLHNPEDPKSHRRSVYRFIVRSQQQPFMTTLDCADPSMQVGKRSESVSPLQALVVLNNSLVLTMSKHFAAKLGQLPDPLPARVERGYYEAMGRPPSAEDRETLSAYAQEFGLTNFCRVLFNLNAFAFVD